MEQNVYNSVKQIQLVVEGHIIKLNIPEQPDCSAMDNIKKMILGGWSK